MTYFFPYIYNRVYSELTSRNSLSRSRLACSRLSGHIQSSVNNPDTDGPANLLNTTAQHLIVTDSNNNRIRLDWKPSKREINTHCRSQTRV